MKKIEKDNYANLPHTRVDAPNDGEVIIFGTPFTKACRAIWVGVAGDIEVKLSKGTELVYKNVPAGRFVISAVKVNIAGTSATDLIAEW